MGATERASNKLQGAKGWVKEATGRLTGNRDLKSKGAADQAKAGMKNAGEDVKNAVHRAKDAASG